MENIKNWFKNGTPEDEKVNILEIIEEGINQKDDNLEYEINIHNKLKDLIKALDSEDMEAVTKLFPEIDSFLSKEQEVVNEKYNDVILELEKTKNKLINKEINSEEVAKKVKELILEKDNLNKRVDYLKEFGPQIKEKMLSLYKKMSGDQ